MSILSRTDTIFSKVYIENLLQQMSSVYKTSRSEQI